MLSTLLHDTICPEERSKSERQVSPRYGSYECTGISIIKKPISPNPAANKIAMTFSLPWPVDQSISQAPGGRYAFRPSTPLALETAGLIP